MQSTNVMQADSLNAMHNSDTDNISSQISIHEKYEEVSRLLRKLRAPGHDVDHEITEILNDAKNEASSQTDGKEEATWEEVFNYRPGTMIGCGLMFFQAMTGINSVTFYSTTIFGLAGFSQSIIGMIRNFYYMLQYYLSSLYIYADRN